jgi:hypothetical protein
LSSFAIFTPEMNSVKIPSTNNQISNKSQHAAQAPALRVTQIQKSKQRMRLLLRPMPSSPAHQILRRGACNCGECFGH